MPQFRTTRRVRHAPEDMFALVADVERYPEFVPLCHDLKVRRRVPGEAGMETVTAAMTVAYGPIRETFTSQAILDRPNLTIGVKYLDGPFSRLDNRWNFRAVGAGDCDVEFFISYEFKSRPLAFVMGTVFDKAFRRFADAFERRADHVHGRRSIPA